MSTVFWGKTSYAEQQAVFATQSFYGLLILLVGPASVLLGWWLRRALTWRYYLVLVPLSALWLRWWWQYLALHAPQPIERVEWWWAGTLLASPLVAFVLQGWHIVANFFRPHDIQDHLAEQQADLQRKNAQLSRSAASAIGQAASQLPGMLSLGRFISAELLPKELGIQRHQNEVHLEERLLDQHMLIIGTTGSGKSSTLKRLVVETLQASDRDIFFVDGKGDITLALEIAQLIYNNTQEPVPLLSLGNKHQGCVYHGFRGDHMDIYNRLGAMIGVEDASDGARYFADISRDILQLACYAPVGPPRSFEALRERLSTTWLRTAYRDDLDELEVIASLDRDPKKLDGLLVRLRRLMRDFTPIVGEEGFVLEESRGAIFSLRTLSVGDTARSFLGFLMEDLKDFAGKRQQRPGLLIIDEFGSFQTEQIVALLTLARSAHLGVVLAAQDVASLGKEEQQRQLILANTRTKFLMVTEFPEEVAKLAGTVLRIEAGLQVEDGQATGMGTARVQHAFRIDMDEVRQLQTGEGFLIRQGHAVKFRVNEVKGIRVTDSSLAQLPKRPYIRETTVYEAPRPTAHTIKDLEL